LSTACFARRLAAPPHAIRPRFGLLTPSRASDRGAVTAAADLDNGSVKRSLRVVAGRLDPYRGNPGVDEFFALA
jgi:hypothetical protein